jgi:hypothetical protein
MYARGVKVRTISNELLREAKDCWARHEWRLPAWHGAYMEDGRMDGRTAIMRVVAWRQIRMNCAITIYQNWGQKTQQLLYHRHE